MSSCIRQIENRETTESTLGQSYTIEPGKILESLARGEKGVFLPETAPELTLSSPSQPVNWKQVDYFQIADALHEYVWGESLEDWNLYFLDFSLGCNEINNGLQYGQFTFFKIEKIGGRQTRITHNIEIDPKNKSVSAWQTNYYPSLVTWKSIDLINTKISADEALQIAERDGGYSKRTAVNNSCNISVGISRDTANYSGWIVIYSPSIFIDKIDPITGK